MDLIPTTELMAVNAMLRAIGESPLNSLEDSGVVDAVLAQQTLEYVSRNVQERGWHWNTLEGLSLPLTYPSGEIPLPLNTLKVDTVGPDECLPSIQRGYRLFNKKTNSFIYTKPVTVDLVEFLPFDQLPQAARTYITFQAVRKFQQDRVGSETLSKFQETDEKIAWQQLLSAESEALDATIFDSVDMQIARFR